MFIFLEIIKKMKINKIIKSYPIIGDALEFIINTSDSNFNPYHNLNHNLTVMYFSYQLGISENLSKQEMTELLLAAIFHDYNHSGGKEKDDYNIKEAKKGVVNFISKYDVKIDKNRIYRIIDATEFPYKIKDENLTLQQEIIRDADMLQLIEDNRIQTNIIGLQTELKRSYSEHLKLQKEFMENLKLRLKASKKLQDKFFPDIIEELNLLVKFDKKK